MVFYRNVIQNIHPVYMKKTKYFPILPDKKTNKVEDFSPYMMKNGPEKYPPTKN